MVQGVTLPTPFLTAALKKDAHQDPAGIPIQLLRFQKLGRRLRRHFEPNSSRADDLGKLKELTGVL